MDAVGESIENVGLGAMINNGLSSSQQKPPDWKALQPATDAKKAELGGMDPMAVVGMKLGKFCMQQWANGEGRDLSQARRKSQLSGTEGGSEPTCVPAPIRIPAHPVPPFPVLSERLRRTERWPRRRRVIAVAHACLPSALPSLSLLSPLSLPSLAPSCPSSCPWSRAFLAVRPVSSSTGRTSRPARPSMCSPSTSPSATR
jgi:hypothetical protein